MLTSALPTVAARLARAARAALARPSTGIRRAEVPLEGTEALDWLAAQPAGDRFFWAPREGADALAAWGVAEVVDAPSLAKLADCLQPHIDRLPPGAGWYGTGRFDPGGFVAGEWAGFGRARFVLPRFELARTPGGMRLACHVTPADREAPARLEEALARLAVPVRAPSGDALPGRARMAVPARRPTRRSDEPDRAGWDAAVGRALAAFEEGGLRKVVLARRTVFAVAGTLDPLGALARLRASAPGCYHVLVEAEGAAFVSATPERLFRIRDGFVETEAVAGTRPRKEAGDLLASEKDRREHAIVVDDITTRLAPLVGAVEADEGPALLALRRRAHLRTRLGGVLRGGVRALDLLRALHPTPAVGGTPREAACAFIADAEGFDRGVYAGPVGRIGRDGEGREVAEFAVGIRSALVRSEQVILYAGAGIVAGSEAAAEWAEVDGKMSDLALALGLT